LALKPAKGEIFIDSRKGITPDLDMSDSYRLKLPAARNHRAR
jgi:hypothetical protein